VRQGYKRRCQSETLCNNNNKSFLVWGAMFAALRADFHFVWLINWQVCHPLLQGEGPI
jgi:hypothetical protein